MKAIVCKKLGTIEDLELTELPSPKPGAGQAVIAVEACSLNFPDTLIVEGKYQFKPDPPFSPGGEIAGTVKEVGEGASLRVGDRVVAMMTWGGLAEEVVVDAAATLRIPEGVEPALAACIPTAHGTVLHALRDRAALQKGETLLVLGAAGGVGLAAVELGKLMGARVIAAASSPEKLALCKEYGADHLVDYTREDLKNAVKKITGGEGADVVFDPVGGAQTEAALRATAWKGRLLVVGFASGEIPKIPLNLTLLKGCAILGVFWGSFLVREHQVAKAQLDELLGWLAEGKIRPHVSGRYPLEKAKDALREVKERKVRGKALVLVRM
jgi:NADPH2:quinone reductase